MMKNFDYIKPLTEEIPSFSQLHAYCDKAEIFQKAFPEESANNARKALEWLVKNHLTMANVTLDPHETLNAMLKRPEIDAFIDDDWQFEKDIYTVKKIGNFASHAGEQCVLRNNAFVCLQNLGIIFQIRDDIFDYYDSKEIGKPTGNDIVEGKLTLPVIYALKSTGDEEMMKLARKVKAHTVTADEIAQLVAFTKENGGIEYADKRMWDFHAEAMNFLDTYVEDKDIYNALKAYLDFVIERKA